MAAVLDPEKPDNTYLEGAPPLKDALEIIDAKDVSPDEVLRVSAVSTADIDQIGPQRSICSCRRR